MVFTLLKKISDKRVKNSMIKSMDSLCSTLSHESKVFLQTIETAEKTYGFDKDFYDRMTISVFIKFSLIDIFLLYKMFLKTEDSHEKNIIARTIAVHVSEFLNDVGKLIVKPLNSILFGIEDEDLKQKLKNVRQHYNLIKDMYAQTTEIRNYVSAHKDRDVRA